MVSAAVALPSSLHRDKWNSVESKRGDALSRLEEGKMLLSFDEYQSRWVSWSSAQKLYKSDATKINEVSSTQEKNIMN